jgi:ribosomal silencing factor RsfS
MTNGWHGLLVELDLGDFDALADFVVVLLHSDAPRLGVNSIVVVAQNAMLNNSGKTMTMKSGLQGEWLGADCGDVKPRE